MQFFCLVLRPNWPWFPNIILKGGPQRKQHPVSQLNFESCCPFYVLSRSICANLLSFCVVAKQQKQRQSGRKISKHPRRHYSKTKKITKCGFRNLFRQFSIFCIFWRVVCFFVFFRGSYFFACFSFFFCGLYFCMYFVFFCILCFLYC